MLAIAAGLDTARRRGEDFDEAGRLALARTFCRHVVAAWWSALTGGDQSLALREPFEPVRPVRLSEAMKALAANIGSSLASLDVEVGAHNVGLAYIGM
ncbi:MAG TPA: hypothetical protein VFF00_02735, partial [Candidatus Elarobacter sp.]|nr:hypothetical protein [Candidatus Elarobacter sp.]